MSAIGIKIRISLYSRISAFNSAKNVGESNLAVRNFMKDHGVNFPVVLDKDRQVLNAYDVTPLPTTFLINPDGEIVKVVTGEMTERMIHDYMNMIKPEGSS